MHEQLIYLILTCVATFALYPLWINFVYKYHLDQGIREDGPKTHYVKRKTPTMGGFAFLLTVSIITFLFNSSREQTLLPIFVVSIVGLMGMFKDLAKVYNYHSIFDFLNISFGTQRWTNFFSFSVFSTLLSPIKELFRIVGSSDRRGLASWQQFLIQALAGGFVAYWTYFKLGWDYIWFPLVGNINVGFLYPIFIFFLFILVLNFVALSDGLDGLVAGLSIIAFSAFWVIASILHYNSLASLAATFIGALLAYLYFNIHPARIFMGDVGSQTLGAALTLFAILMHREIAMVVILLVFLVDGASSPLQQFSAKLTKKRLFRMAPIHHHFELLGWPETKVVQRFWLFGAIFAFIGILIAIL